MTTYIPASPEEVEAGLAYYALNGRAPTGFAYSPHWNPRIRQIAEHTPPPADIQYRGPGVAVRDEGVVVGVAHTLAASGSGVSLSLEDGLALLSLEGLDDAEVDAKVAAALAAGDYQTAAEADARIASAIAAADITTAAELAAGLAPKADTTALVSGLAGKTAPADVDAAIATALGSGDYQTAAEADARIAAALAAGDYQTAAESDTRIASAIAAALAFGDYQTASESDIRIAAALAAGDYQTAAESDARIAAALAAGDYQTAAESDARIATALAAAITRLAYWENMSILANGSVGFAFPVSSNCFIHARFHQKITFRTIWIFVTTAAGNVEGSLWNSDGTNLNRIVTSGSVAAVGASALQGLDLGAFQTPTLGADYWFDLGVSSGSLRILTGNILAAQSAAMQVLPFPPVGRFRQKTITLPATTPQAISSLAAVVSQPAPWIMVVDGV